MKGYSRCSATDLDETGDRGKGGEDLQFAYLLPWLV